MLKKEMTETERADVQEENMMLAWTNNSERVKLYDNLWEDADSIDSLFTDINKRLCDMSESFSKGVISITTAIDKWESRNGR